MSKVILPNKRNANPLEKAIEKKVCEHAKALGCLVYKFTSPARRSVPDRLFILPDSKGVFFIEFKRRGQKPTTAQALEIAKIQKQGTAVFVIDSVISGQVLISEMVKFFKPVLQFIKMVPPPAAFVHSGKAVTMADPFFN